MGKAVIVLWILATLYGLEITTAFFLPYRSGPLERYKRYIQEASKEIKNKLSMLNVQNISTTSNTHVYLVMIYNALRHAFQKKVASKLGDARIAMLIGQEQCKNVKPCYDEAETKINRIENATIADLSPCITKGMERYTEQLRPIANLEQEGLNIIRTFKHVFKPCMDNIPMESTCMQKEMTSIKATVDGFNQKYQDAILQREKAVDAGRDACWSCLKNKIDNSIINIRNMVEECTICIQEAELSLSKE